MAYAPLLRGLKLCKVFLKGILTYEVNGKFLEGIFTYQSDWEAHGMSFCDGERLKKSGDF